MSGSETERLHTPHSPPLHPWKRWGPYLSERAWGTVREDYSENGDAWNYFPHDHARSRAYMWGDDGIGGICDRYQILIFAFAFWNRKDPILKERLFGLNPYEGNHGEDVKERYFHIDATPTHSYMHYRYHYPIDPFPYNTLVEENRKRSVFDREYELVDTGIFQNDRYFDIGIEYAKHGPNDIFIRLEIRNRSQEAAHIDVLPQLWFRNRWATDPDPSYIPEIREGPRTNDCLSLFADSRRIRPMRYLSFDYHLEPMYLYGEAGAKTIFTNNETNYEKLFPGTPNRTPYVKDAFHELLIHNNDKVCPEKAGTKAALHYENIEIDPKGTKTLYFRLCDRIDPDPLSDPESIFLQRKQEADAFYATVHSPSLSEKEKLLQRRAFAGMLWSKQFYFYNIKEWLYGKRPQEADEKIRKTLRNLHWEHVSANNIISMPDKWEYPWFASWDLAFHSVTLALVDIEYAKEQIHLVLSHLYQHPNGQIPAYEWEFSDLNPPVQAWAVRKIYMTEKEGKGSGDVFFLKRCFLKLMRNFGWWVNKVDKEGNNFFEGGFLGLDNISVIDRDVPLGSGGRIEESDGTGWMGFFSLHMWQIALELSLHDPVFEGLAIGFFEYFVYVAIAMQPCPNRSIAMWDESDGFFYDVISYPDGKHASLKIRSFVGVIPFYSLDFLREEDLEKLPKFRRHFTMFLKINPDMTKHCVEKIEKEGKTVYLFSLMTRKQMGRFLEKLFDPEEFLSEYGLRSLSKYHEKHPFTFDNNTIAYEPGESTEKIKGGNSNWRGPVWMPTNFLVLESLRKLSEALGKDYVFSLQGTPRSLHDLSETLRSRLLKLFEGKDNSSDPTDFPLFYEHFHPETGRGLGASHQTGWTGLIANLLQDK